MLPIPLNAMVRTTAAGLVLPTITAAVLPRLNCKDPKGAEQELERILNPHTSRDETPPYVNAPTQGSPTSSRVVRPSVYDLYHFLEPKSNQINLFGEL